MKQPLTIIVASVYKPLLNLLERAMEGSGAVLRQMEPDSEMVLKAVGGNQKALVVLHERRGQTEWLDLAKALHQASVGATTIALGESTDVGAVARGIAHGIANYVPIGHGTDLLEIRRIVTNAVAGEQAPGDSLYGRVKAMLPSAKDGTLLSHSGKVVSAEDAIQQCVTLGLTPEEIAGYLGVSANDANKIAGKAHRRQRESGIPSLPFSSVGRLAISAIAVGAIALLISRRGPPPLPYELAPVTGTVTLDGKTVSQGVVRLTPDGTRATKGPTGIGVIDAQGNFRVVTAGHDGAVVGSHRVSVLPTELRQPDPTKYVLQAMPAKYTRNTTSGLSCEVQSGEPNHLALKLLTPDMHAK